MGETVKLVKIQLKFKNVCSASNVPNSSNWLDWSLDRADSGSRSVCLPPEVYILSISLALPSKLSENR